jgi:hypothetical protein
MKIYIIIISFLIFKTNSPCQIRTLITSNQDDNYSELEVNTLYQINFTRVLSKAKPLYTNKHLNYHSKLIATKLQTKNIDTIINNVLIVYYSDSISLNQPILKDTFDLIGIHTLPHQYKCQIMVITLDKRREQIKWKELDCPKFLKKMNR